MDTVSETEKRAGRVGKRAGEVGTRTAGKEKEADAGADADTHAPSFTN
jgi:hypothetical protein